VEASVLPAAFEINSLDDIDFSAIVPRHLNTIVGNLCNGQITFSRPQLYQLLKILSTLLNEVFLEEDVDFEIPQKWHDDWFDLAGRQLEPCLEGLREIALSTFPKGPTSEARETVLTLQRLNLAIRNLRRYRLENTEQSDDKRKAEILDEVAGFNCAGKARDPHGSESMRIHLRSAPGRKSAPSYYDTRVQKSLRAKFSD
jgi:hypothetical protein